MTLEELRSILKSRTFKSSVKNRDEHYMFRFTEIYVIRDGKPLGIYELTQTEKGFTIIVVQKLQDIFTDDFKNVILNIPSDNRFPIVINFDSMTLQQGKGFDITLEAV